MKTLFILAYFFSYSAFSQTDPKSYMSSFDSKVYSLKTKGVKDFVVDIQSSKLSKQVNDQLIFGKVENLIFRTYWTASPERLSIEVVGLPEGFVEIKEELKLAILSSMDNLLPLATFDRFTGYSITATTKPKEFLAKDQSGVAAIPSYDIVFDDEDKLSLFRGHRPVGTFEMAFSYDKKSFSDGKWVLTSQVTTSSENGQTMTSKKSLEYGTSQGIAVLEEVEINVEQKWANPKIKPFTDRETLSFKNYKINTGDALKHFLGDASQK